MVDQSSQCPPLSILLLGTQIAIGGAQRLLLDQAEWFHAQGHRVRVVFFYDRDRLHDVWQKRSAFPIDDLKAFASSASSGSQVIKLLSGMWNLWKLMRREKFDAVITFTQDSNLLGLPLAWLAGIPVRIGTYLGAVRGMGQLRKTVHTWVTNVGFTNRIITASTRTRANAIEEGIRPERLEVIFNGIRPFTADTLKRSSIRKQLGLKDEDIFVLAVGRLVYEKGHEFLVQAMQDVTKKNPQVKAGICGNGPLHAQLASQISGHGLGEQVKLLGQWEDVRDLLAAADIFVLPSRWEGLPMALLEAMMAELPVIATRVEGVEEVVEPGVHGLLVPLEDVRGLAEAILELAGDAERRHAMGAKGSMRVREAYTTDNMCRKYLQVMNDLRVSKLGVNADGHES